MLSKRIAFFLMLVAALLATSSALGQSTATIQGTVTDNQGGVVPGATVTVRHVETNITRTTISGDLGQFRVPNLPVGTYEVIVELSGFATHVRSGLRLALNQDAVLEIALQPATLAETITVTADSPRTAVLAAGLFIGSGMGLSMLSLLLAVQHGVARSHLGLATSLNQFSRSVGAAVGVAAMGALMTRQLAGVSIPGGVDAVVCVGAIAIRTGPLAARRICSPISRAVPNNRDTPLTSSITSGPTTSSRGVKVSASVTSDASDAVNEYKQVNMSVVVN